MGRTVEDVSFSKMVYITLVNCRSLPCLGGLPMLKRIGTEGMDEVKSLGREFYGETCTPNNPFPSLESLSFSNMQQWQDWDNPSSSEPYPLLHHLSIQNCPKLIKKLPAYLPSLPRLSISGCLGLQSPLLELPFLSEFRVSG